MRSQQAIGEILIEAGLINETQLRAALTAQERFGGRVGQHLIKAQAITEPQLLDALSHQLGVAKINFYKSRIYLEALKLVPKNVCEGFGVIPVAVKEAKGHKKLLLAMCDPTDYEAVRQVEFVSGYTVVTVVALESDIERAVNYCYNADGLRESHGLSEMTDLIEFDAQNPMAEDEERIPVIITADGEMDRLDNRFGEIAARALVDLLVAKGVITREEFHRRLEDLKKHS